MRSLLFLVAVLSVTVVSGTRVQAQPSSETVMRARTLFEQGQAAYAAGHFDEAARKMVEAYELTRSAELAFNAARVFERMSDYDAALRYFEIYLRAATTLTPEERAALETRM